MKLYPIVIKLEDKICCFIGGGNQIYKKILDLMPYSPRIFVFAENVIPELKDLAENHKKIIWQKHINYEILLKSYLIFISDESIHNDNNTLNAFNSIKEIESVIKFSEKYSKLVCFLDRPEYCDFFNTHIYEKGSILISISTKGVAPVIGNYIKQQLNQIINDDLILLTDFLAKYRPKIVNKIKSYEKRIKFYENILNSDFIEILKQNEEEALNKLIQLIIQYSEP